MRGSHLLAGASLAALLLAGLSSVPALADVTLAGQVTSAEEGPMEGVLVSARKDGATITTTVVSDDKGHYSFPARKLEPGHYTLAIRAIGYALDAPKAVDLADGNSASTDLKLAKVGNITGQLTNAEWLASMPGSEADKKTLLACTNCHTLQRVAQSSYDADQFLELIGRMARYANNTSPLKPQIRVAKTDPTTRFGPGAIRLAHYLATVNLSQAPAWNYPLKTLPRVTGAGTKVVITEYALPRSTMMPHDVVTDDGGMVWFTDFATEELGSLDPKTGKVVEHPYPMLRQGFPEGSLDLERDEEGNFWLAMMFQGGIAKFDKTTGQFQTFPVPPNLIQDDTQQGEVAAQHWEVDGKVWMADNGIEGAQRLDLKTGTWESIRPFADLPKGQSHGLYGIFADSHNNLLFNDFGGEAIGRIDAKTLAVTLYPTPTKKSRPRRGRLDDQDRVWFAEFYGDKAGMFDEKTGEMKEFAVPTPWTAPYDAVLDKHGDLWTAGMETDRIVRIDPKTGSAIEYPLPRQTNIRRIFVDNSTDPVTFWVGNNGGAAI
jgi:virginiamycin B lyase